jgi:hypothetical protein
MTGYVARHASRRAPRKDVNNECAIREEFLERPVGVEREVETAFPL